MDLPRRIAEMGLVSSVVIGGMILCISKNLFRGPRSATVDASDAVVAVRKRAAFKVIAAVLTTLDDIVWLLSFKFLHVRPSKMYSYPKPGDPVVRVQNPDRPLTTQCRDANTVFEIVQSATQQYADCSAFGTRTYLGETDPEGPRGVTKKIFGETVWRTYREVGERAMNFGAALRKVGVVPFPGSAKEFEGIERRSDGGSCMMIYENTCDDWTTAFFGASSQSVIVATSYASLGFDAMLDSVEETGASVLMCNRQTCESMIDKGDAYMAGVKEKGIATIVFSNNYIDPKHAEQALPKSNSGISIYSVDDFIELGKANPVDPSPPSPDTLSVIMYTSGSTGKPKGVMLTHQCVTSAAGGAVNTLLSSGQCEEGKEVYLAYLPAAHILELTVEVSLFSIGSALGYADPKTISSKGAVRQRPDGSINSEPTFPHPPGAIQEFRPTIMAGVPKVWDVLKAGASAKIATMSPMVQAVLGEMVAVRDAALRSGTDAPLFGRIFYKRLGTMVGGRLKAVISGGGPLSSSTQTFVRATMCPTFVQGYGLTETNGATCVQDFDDVRDGIAGAPLSSVELKLVSVDVEDTMGQPYLSTDTQHVVQKEDGAVPIPCLGRGELWIRGSTVAKGYFKLPDKTKSDFTDDGWFKTGDICIWTEDGSIKIVDRLKNLVKLRGGEYVAIENMEKEYAQSVYVDQLNGGVMVIADGDMDRACLVAQANLVEIRKLGKTLGLDEDPVALCQNPSIEDAVRKDMVGTAMKNLSPLEKIVAVKLLPGTEPGTAPLSESSPWTVENGGLLASNKLGRKTIQKELAGLVQKLKQKGIR